MRTIRKFVFETNSSSAHSLTFATKGSGAKYNNSKILDWKGEEYGWEREEYHSPQAKFSYYLVALQDWLSMKQKQEYAKRHKIPATYSDTIYDFSFGSLERIARAIQDNDKYWIDHYKVIDKENIEYISKLASQKVRGLYDFLISKGCTFKSFDYTNDSHEFIYDGTDYELFDALEHLKDAPENEWKKYPDISNWIDFGGYIDHQSGPSEDSDCRKLAEFSYEEVFDWIFGDSSVITDNDNH